MSPLTHRPLAVLQPGARVASVVPRAAATPVTLDGRIQLFVIAIALIAGLAIQALTLAAQTASQPIPPSANPWRTEVQPGDGPIVVSRAPLPIEAGPMVASPVRPTPPTPREPAVTETVGMVIGPMHQGTDYGLALVLSLMFLLPTISLSLSVGNGISDLRRSHRPTPKPSVGPRPPVSAPAAPVDVAASCRRMIEDASRLWRQAEVAVMNLDQSLPIRMLLQNEMDLIRRRLAATPSSNPPHNGAVSQRETDDYWRMLATSIGKSVGDLQRIVAIAEASQASFGRRTEGPRMPETLDDAYFILGAHRGTDDEAIKRLVRALRQVWHPDLARDEADRAYREFRIRQINVANDLLAARQVQA